MTDTEPSWYPVTDPVLDAPDGAVLTFPNGLVYERCGQEWCVLQECTGITASYCPIHGDCSCSKRPDGLPTQCDNGCPLHDPRSMHGEVSAHG